MNNINNTIKTIKMDNLDDEFGSSWDIPIEQPKQVEPKQVEPKQIEIKQPIHTEPTILSPLEQLIKERSINDNSLDEQLNLSTDDYEAKIIKLCKKGEEIINEYKERGIKVQGIEPSMIMTSWEDCKYLNANPNTQFLNSLIKSTIEFGYDTPRPIQCITSGRIAMKGDIIVQAVAGNGKTAAFVFGSAIRVNPQEKSTQVLILSPTQLLTDQTTEVVKNLTKQTGIIVHCHRGGLYNKYDYEVPHIIVGCPGRVLDLINKGKIRVNNLKTLILDEGDDLLKQGFREQMQNIIQQLANTIQICLFSATLPKGILELCNKFMVNPAFVILPEDKVMTELVTQWYVQCPTLNEKDGCIVDLIISNPSETTIIFFNSCSRLEKVSKIISECNTPIQHLCIHSKMNPADKTSSIENFKAGHSKILLASDIAARGLDIQNVSLVINYDIPPSIDTYIHRIGRSGRGAKLGNSITLIMSEEDKQNISYIINMHKIPIKQLESVNITSKQKQNI